MSHRDAAGPVYKGIFPIACFIFFMHQCEVGMHTVLPKLLRMLLRSCAQLLMCIRIALGWLLAGVPGLLLCLL